MISKQLCSLDYNTSGCLQFSIDTIAISWRWNWPLWDNKIVKQSISPCLIKKKPQSPEQNLLEKCSGWSDKSWVNFKVTFLSFLCYHLRIPVPPFAVFSYFHLLFIFVNEKMSRISLCFFLCFSWHLADIADCLPPKLSSLSCYLPAWRSCPICCHLDVLEDNSSGAGLWKVDWDDAQEYLLKMVLLFACASNTYFTISAHFLFFSPCPHFSCFYSK